MAHEVYANGRSLSAKSAGGKSIASFPDVCFTPAPPPPGVPVPYPNTGFSSDTTKGSKSVKLSGKESMLRDKSYFKTSTGDEAGSAPKKGAITSKIKGKIYFTSWSMDVKIEGENVVRHMDMTTHNHGSSPSNTPPWMHTDSQALADNPNLCKEAEKKAEEECRPAKAKSKNKKMGKCSKKCVKAQKCILIKKKDDKKSCCAPENTGHHLVEVHCFTATGGRAAATRLPGFESYNDLDAPCVCASTKRNEKSHGIMHAVQGKLEAAYGAGPANATNWPGAGALLKDGSGNRAPAVSHWKYGEARDAGVLAHKQAFPHCNSKCVQKQLDEYHKDQCGLEEDTPVRTDPGTRSAGELTPDQETALTEEIERVSNVSTNNQG